MDRIIIDEPTLRRNALAYLHSPQAQNVLEVFDFPFIWCLFLALIACGFGLCMLPTVVWTLAGLKALWYVAKLEPFEAMWDNPAKKPETLRPLICHGIIIGPDHKHALVLGTFRPAREYSIDRVTQKANLFAAIYADREEGAGAEHATMRDLLRDDIYRPSRRRRVPEPCAEGLDLFLFDVELNPREGRSTAYDTVLFAFVADFDEANQGESGGIAAIPWAVVAEAVHINL
jgi:hypothetical protein